MTSFENLLMLIANEDLDIDVYAIVDEGDARDKISRFSRILNDKRDGSKQEEKALQDFLLDIECLDELLPWRR